MRYLLTKTQLILIADVSERMCLKKPSNLMYLYGDIKNVQFYISGPCATTHVESGGFCRSRPGVEHPDIMFHFVPTQVIVAITYLIYN